MKNMFKNPWAKGGEMFTDWMGDFRENIMLENDVDTEVTVGTKGLNTFGSNGFLNVKLNTGTIVSLAQYCKVSNLKFNADKSREEFKILEWPHLNKLASVACEVKGVSRFSNINYESAATIYFNKSKGELTIGSIKVPAYTSESDPITNGTHKIWLPDYFHSYGNPYLSDSKFAGIWFRLGSEGSDRYLHAGSVSLGCVSVGLKNANDNTPEHYKWNDVYNYLCKKRSGTKYIGNLIVS